MKAVPDDDSGYRFSIEIENLQDLLDLVEEEGSIILDTDCITIYDDYVE